MFGTKYFAIPCVALMITGGVAWADPSGAQTATTAQLLKDVGGSERINYAGKLRMLSQRIPAAACNLHAGVGDGASAQILEAASEEFNKIINALEHGDPSLNIKGREGRRKTLEAIADVRQEWEPVVAAARLVRNEGMSDGLNQQMADQNGPLLEAAKLLVSQITGAYSDPAAVLQSDAIRIDIAGRQRMLSQRISKDICFVLSGVNVDQSTASLKKTVALFDVSHNALQFGKLDVGLKAPRDPQIIEGMRIVADHWAGLQPSLTQVLETGTLSEPARLQVFKGLNALLVDMNKVVGMFARVSKQNI